MDLDALENVRGAVDALALQRVILAAIHAAADVDPAEHAALAATFALRAFGYGSDIAGVGDDVVAKRRTKPRAVTVSPELSLWLDHAQQAQDSLGRRGVVKASTLAALRRLVHEVGDVSDDERALLAEHAAAIEALVDDRRGRGVDVDDEAASIVLTTTRTLLAR